MLKRVLVLTVVASALGLFAAAGAQGAVSVKKWESLTCAQNKDIPTTLGPLGTEVGYEKAAPTLTPPPEQCTDATTGKHFSQAAGHPNFGITDFRLTTAPHPPTEIGGFPTAFLKEIVVETPEGLSVNPEALPQCAVKTFEEGKCSSASMVGVNYLTVAAQSPVSSVCAPAGECLQARVALPVYNLVPFEEAPSMVGFLTESGPTFIVGSLSPVDQHVIFTISHIHPPSPTSPPIIESRLVFNGVAGDGTYLTMPSNCAGGQTSLLHLRSQGPPFEAEETTTTASYTTPSGATGCELVPFEPGIGVATAGNEVDSPQQTTVNVTIPWDPNSPRANSYLKEASITLPEGMGLNPASANGLVACSDEQFHYHTNTPIECPAASRIGSVEVQTPSLPADSIGGDVYVAEPKSNDARTGEQFRIFIHAFSKRFGVNVRLIGHVTPNLQTGQLTVVVPENPQATFSSFKVRLNGGSRGTLTSPPTCGPNTTNATMTPWSGHNDHNTPSSSFTLSGDPGGGACPQTLGARKFTPGYTAKSDSTAAGAYSPFRVNLTRADGEQELKAVNVTLPKGLTGKLAGIPYCSEGDIAAAQASGGSPEKTNYSCPAASQIGETTTAAGSGTGPIRIGGKAFLAGPYKGAPLSMVVITPAVAGPYDLGTVVVRVALNVIPETAQVNAVSDPIPDVFDGVKLSIRAIEVNVNRTEFMLNPTGCAAQATAGSISGGGANPADPAAWSSYAVSDPFAATGCNGLKFKPKLHVRLKGPTKRSKFPQLRAVLEARKGDANIARTALTLPHSLFLEQGHIGTVCTRPQLASHTCPKASVYGHAEAVTPLLDKKLKGNVYLVSSNHQLPDLLADLRGQVEIYLRGVIGSKHGGLKTVFNKTPDVPVKKFILNMKGGEKSLLVNSTNTCAKTQRAVLNIKGQNGKKVKNNKFRLNIASCGKKHR
jgi:hypothetical protein